jgi:plasmid stabilization system protein ParE
MSAYRVIVLARADRDVRSIFAWLWSHSPKGAERWLAAFESAKEKLTEDPARLALIPENVRSSHELRHVLFKTRRGRVYRAIFTIDGEEVRVLRVRRPAQRPIRGRDLPKG